jgi:hypothetical protein
MFTARWRGALPHGWLNRMAMGEIRAMVVVDPRFSGEAGHRFLI